MRLSLTSIYLNLCNIKTQSTVIMTNLLFKTRHETIDNKGEINKLMGVKRHKSDEILHFSPLNVVPLTPLQFQKCEI